MARQISWRDDDAATRMGQSHTAETERLMRENAQQHIPSYGADETSYLRRMGGYAKPQQSQLTGSVSSNTGYYRPPSFDKDAPRTQGAATRGGFDELNETAYSRIFDMRFSQDSFGDDASFARADEGVLSKRTPHGASYDAFNDAFDDTFDSLHGSFYGDSRGKSEGASFGNLYGTSYENSHGASYERSYGASDGASSQDFGASLTDSFSHAPFDARMMRQKSRSPYEGRSEFSASLGYGYGVDAFYGETEDARDASAALALRETTRQKQQTDSLALFAQGSEDTMQRDAFRYDDDDAQSVRDGAERSSRGDARRDARKKKKNAVVFLIAAVMVLLAIALGVFLTDRFISPMMLLSTREKTDEAQILPDLPPQAEAQPGDAPARTEAVASSTTAHAAASKAPQGVQADVTIPAWSVYLVQAGAFSQAQNADNYADTIRNMGGAGYVLKTDYYRVMATAFNSEYDAEQVRSTLAAQVASAQVYELSFSEMTFSVTAQQEDMDVITSALAQWPEWIKSLMTMIRKAEAGQLSSQEALVSLMEIQAQLDSGAQALEYVTGARESELVAGLCDMYAESARILADVAAQKTVEAGSTLSRVKYAHIGMCWNYRMLVERLAQQQTQDTQGAQEEQPAAQ